MAPDLHARHHLDDDGTLGNGGPPPSTLAAQLVENISASSRSSRSDETGELKRFFAIIEKVKNQPDLLKTVHQRVDHNHMLIYVYARVVLEGLKWDDPFADRTHLRTEALKAISFLKVTIQETPQVLLFTTDGQSFLFRDHEPLWFWVFPKILKMLGHRQCLALSSAIEDFFRFVFVVASQHGALWPSLPTFTRYFQSNFQIVLDRLRDPLLAHVAKDVLLKLRLPTRSLMDELQDEYGTLHRSCSYAVADVAHALVHASGLLSVLASTVSSTSGDTISNLYKDTVPWILDSVLASHEARTCWRGLVEPNITADVANVLEMLTVFETSTGLDTVVHQKAYCVLAIMCSKLTEEPGELLGETTGPTLRRRSAGLAFVELSRGSIKYKPVSRLTTSQLIPPLQKFLAENDLANTATDFWKSAQLLQQVLLSSSSGVHSSDIGLLKFHDAELRGRVAALKLKTTDGKAAERMTKRRKLSADSSTLPDIVAKLSCLFQKPRPSTTEDLEAIFLEGFPSLNEPDRCVALDLLGYVPCSADNTLSVEVRGKGLLDYHCSLCRAGKPKQEKPACVDRKTKSIISRIFSQLVRLPVFVESRKPRVVAMVTLRRLVSHSDDVGFLDLEKSGAGQWCLQALQSSLRELRIAAGRTMSAFLLDSAAVEPDTEVIRRNRTTALAILKSISDRKLPHLGESTILAWGQVGRFTSGDELNLVLVKLLDYLGHRNMLISAFAFNEILAVSDHRQTTPRGLLEPYWRSLAFSTVRDMVSKPQKTGLVAELLQISVTDLLLQLQPHALPWLVLTKKKDVILKIAEARQEQETWQPLLDNVNLSSTLALLLIQDVPDIEAFSMSLFRQASSHFNGFEFAELLRPVGVETTLELFKLAGAADVGRKPKIRSLLNTMATIVTGMKEGKQKKNHAIGRLLQQHALGFMARLTDVINDTLNQSPPPQEQQRCIRAMEEMIKVGKSYIRIARPQISACLLSALSFDELRPAAFSCWSAMLTHLEVEDVEMLIETTFFVIRHYWKSFDSATKQKGRETIAFLVEQCSPVLQEFASKLPTLSNISDLSELDKKINALRPAVDDRTAFSLFAERLRHENSGVVLQALTELASFLRKGQGFLQASAISEQPDTVLISLARALLDCSAKYNNIQLDITQLCAECLGLIGCLDSNRIETTRESPQFIASSNFEDASETTDFVLFMLEEVLVKSFLSAPDTRLQGFLSYVMQELLVKCDFRTACSTQGRENEVAYRKWLGLPEGVREVLTPFLSSQFVLPPMAHQQTQYPIFQPTRTYGNWLRALVLDLLRRGQNLFAQIIFEPLSRVIRVKDLSVAEFLLPYLVVHIIVGQDISQEDRDNIVGELVSILQHHLPENPSYVEREEMKLYSEAIFRVLDYAKRWIQGKKSQVSYAKPDRVIEAAIGRVQNVLNLMPAELICQRAVECKQYARALFYLEPYAMMSTADPSKTPQDMDRLLMSLQDIYTQIDEPDGLEGISAHLPFIDLNQQILSHRKAGRWTAVQPWYEIRLAKQPDNVDVQVDLLTCLKESGQHDVLLNYVEGMNTTPNTIKKIVPFAVEASWATGRWQTLEKYLSSWHGSPWTEVFNVGVGKALLALSRGQMAVFSDNVHALRANVASSMTHSATSSLQTAHDNMMKCHVLTELEMIAGLHTGGDSAGHQDTLSRLDRRLEVIGAYVNDKQYLLGIRRAAMELMRPTFTNDDISALWLSSARLARKANSMHQSFNAILHASQLGDDSATIENARLLWKDGHNRKAIQVLQGAISNNTFISRTVSTEGLSSSRNPESQKNLLTARANLLLAKWLDAAGQTHAVALRAQYQSAAKTYAPWEKGHYYLGRHYKKVLESEKALKPDDQSDEYLTGETAKLVIENYIRSLNYGTKYLYQTLPRVLTLWLELGAQVDKAPEGKVSLSRELYHRRKAQLIELHRYLSRHIQRMPAYIFYTALPQIVARIAHPNQEVFRILEYIIIKVVEAHPRQALWSLFACMTSRIANERRARGLQILQTLRSVGRKVEGGSYELKQLIRMGEKLAEQLLMACNNGDFQSNRTTTASITRDLNFNHKCTPCPLVVPIEGCLTATLPTLTDNVKKHKAFSGDVITIHSFLDDVLVLGSLAKPRKLSARGSDGKIYGLLIKPKDDLRTDQRLMEFNGMINRSLKRDAESSRRQLYIKTYAVTPLNEECGIIEWIDGLKTLRDILLSIYKTRGISPNYGQIAQMMKEATVSEANVRIFTDQVLSMFPAVLPMWFTSQFPNPSAWFAARLKYTRSCAVMSMVGTILGLGDRHGENVLLEEGNGGVFHVDFNCLFDKGLTFAQPERVPFRLTHNMVAAMGIYAYEGPFRQCSELTLSILRQQEETLMTILEAFIYDPTLDLQRDKRRKNNVVSLNPQSVVDSIKRKVRGLLPDESIPLGVEGQVDELIKQAVNPRNLAAMYIGWCPFL